MVMPSLRESLQNILGHPQITSFTIIISSMLLRHIQMTCGLILGIIPHFKKVITGLVMMSQAREHMITIVME